MEEQIKQLEKERNEWLIESLVKFSEKLVKDIEKLSDKIAELDEKLHQS